jgi:glucuronosyltransferase
MLISKFFPIYLLLLIRHASSYNILAIISLPLHSHYMAFKNLFHELAARGHQVTVINNFPDKNTTNLRYVKLNRELNVNFIPLGEYERSHASFLHLKSFRMHFNIASYAVRQDCEALLTNVNVKAHLSEGNRYDVIFVEQFSSDCALAYAGVHFDAPIIGITSHVLFPWTYNRLGVPFDFASNPYYYSPSSPTESFLAKLEAVIMHLYIHMYSKPYILHKNIYDSFKNHMPKVSLDIDRIGRDRMKMVFAYQHYSITGARLLPPQLLEIAGVHITKPKPVLKVSKRKTNTHSLVRVISL